jgi:hypothetical protein
MSENITHTAVVGDCARLTQLSETICDEFKDAFKNHLEIARLGGVSTGGGFFIPELLTKYREAWPSREPDRLLPQSLAFVLGWICHRAADLQMKPLFNELDGDCGRFPTDCSIYHDVFLFREIYAAGKRPPYSPATLETDMKSLSGAQKIPVAEIEEIFHALLQRSLISMHTIMPDLGNAEDWIPKLIRHRQKFGGVLKRYAEALANPDPEKFNRFVVEPNFYDKNDPIIQQARSGKCSAETNAGTNQSLYAQILARGMGYLQAASDYFSSQIEEDDLRDKLERGFQGLK